MREDDARRLDHKTLGARLRPAKSISRRKLSLQCGACKNALTKYPPFTRSLPSGMPPECEYTYVLINSSRLSGTNVGIPLRIVASSEAMSLGDSGLGARVPFLALARLGDTSSGRLGADDNARMPQ